MITIGIRSDIPARESILELSPETTLASARATAATELKLDSLSEYLVILVKFGQDVRQIEDEDELLNAVNGSVLVFHAPASMKTPVESKKQREKEDEKGSEKEDEGKFKGFQLSSAFRKIAEAKTKKTKSLALQYFDINCEEIWTEVSSQWCKLSAKRAVALIRRDTLGAEEPEIFNAVMSWGEANSKREQKELKQVLQPLIPHVRWCFLSISDIARASGLLSPEQALNLFQFVSMHASRIQDDSLTDLRDLNVPEALGVFNNKRRTPTLLPVSKQKYTLTTSGKYSSLNSADTFESLHDQDFKTGCAVNSGSNFIMAEFKTAVVVKSIRLGPLHQNPSSWGPVNGNGAQIEWSNDKSTWTKVGITVNHAHTQWADYSVGKIKAKYWRLTHTSYLGTSAFEFS